ncbi:hypothetical protein [Lysinibacter sp. HNR]|uniref:hypothetical protein n=1 Tax=Lysinibacter sp. HNR TaxID=3031408 RepID=UPI002435F6E9|nr:hypothetical protein [Lysinibacter sp. HNR]WGD36886.1 hypothetical protein FrondiHNR_10590 [Lysinibacter sp. HNR]
MDSGVLAGWSLFYTATATAAAALVGLLIVAISVNITQILSSDVLPSRALSTVSALTLALIISLLALIPHERLDTLSIMILVVSSVVLVSMIASTKKILAQIPRRPLGENLLKVLNNLAQITPVIVGAILLFAQVEAGLLWVSTGILLIFIGSIFNSWVLLVEILR